MIIFQTDSQSKPGARRGEHGQSLVEFTFMSIVIAVLLLGILDLGRAYFTYLALQDAAGEGANYGAVYPNRIAGDDPDNITYRVRNSAPEGSLVDMSTASIDVKLTGVAPGSKITVTVTTQYQLLTPFVGAIAGSQHLPLSAQSVAVITTGNGN
jgi:Flp pilus assembly protein TadG